MAESLFDIFGDHHARQVGKKITRQPLSNNENRGKMMSNGPIKPNAPKKVGELKKSFLSNTGKTLQSTPIRKAFTPVSMNVGNLIYQDTNDDEGKDFSAEGIEFTRPTNTYDNYHKDMFDYLPLPEPEIVKEVSPPNTPPPSLQEHIMESMDCSYGDVFQDDFSFDSFNNDDLCLPDLY